MAEPSNRPLRIGMIAGEVSGDILGAGLIRALRRQHGEIQVEGIAGPRMVAEGAHALFDMEELAVMGFAEVIGRLPRILSVRRQILRHFLTNPPDLLVGIDAPDFNLGVELKLKQAGIPTIHYVSPSVWAWKQKRIFKIARATDLVLAFLPFEKAFYDKFNVPCRFVGHTMADAIPLSSSKEEARRALGVAEQGRYLALLPGSRHAEVELLSPVFLEAARLLRQQLPDLKLLVPMVNVRRRRQFEQLQEQLGIDFPVQITDGQAREVMAASDAILLASGTAALEAMLVKRPMVVGYKLKPLTWWIAKCMVKTPYVSLPNLLADAPLVPELLQDACTGERLAEALLPLLCEDQTALLETFTRLHRQIRCDADNQAATAVLQLIGERNHAV